MKGNLNAFLRDDEAIAIVEYAVAVSPITAVDAAALMALGGSTNTIIPTITGYCRIKKTPQRGTR